MYQHRGYEYIARSPPCPVKKSPCSILEMREDAIFEMKEVRNAELGEKAENLATLYKHLSFLIPVSKMAQKLN